MFGLLGPGGAGKTTLLRILAGTLQPTSGLVQVGGHILPRGAREIWRDVALVPERGYFTPWDNALEYVRFWGRVAGLPTREAKARIADLSALVGLDEIENLVLSEVTVDIETRLNLLQALLTDPRIVLLDEPFTGMAASERENLSEILGTLRARGKTIVLTSPQLGDLRRSCDRVAIMREGSILGAMKTEDLLTQIGRGRHARIFVDTKTPDAVLDAAKAAAGVFDAKATRDVVVVYVDPGVVDHGALAAVLEKYDVRSEAIHEAEITLGDVFRALHERGGG